MLCISHNSPQRYETYHIKKPESSRPSEFSCKKEALGWFPLASAPFSSVFSLVIDIIYVLQKSSNLLLDFLSLVSLKERILHALFNCMIMCVSHVF